MKKRILFISSTNLTTNPRIVKEIKLAVSLGYSVSFLGFSMNNWSGKIEEQHKKELQETVALHYISAERKPFIPWVISSVIEIICKKIYALFSASLTINAYAVSKRSCLLIQWLNENKPNADLIVAHTLATLYPAYKYAKKNKIPFAFDIEDYHPGEKMYNDIINETKRRIFLMKNILPASKYISCASPLIEEEVKKNILLNKTYAHLFTVNNSFSKQDFILPQQNNSNVDKLKLVWFSQNISEGRGLELILPLLNKFSNNIKITLIGNVSETFFNEVLIHYNSFIEILPPLTQTELHQKLTTFDIGLAIEDINADVNRNICLTNKIWSYYQAGLFILATKTSAQEKFIADNKNHGVLFDFSEENFNKVTTELLENKEKIEANKTNRFNAALNNCWENESLKLTKSWELIIN